MSKKRPPADFVKGIASGRIRVDPGANISFGEEHAEEKRKRRKRRAENKRARASRRKNR